MRTFWTPLPLLALLLLSVSVDVMAQEKPKGPTCEEQLTQMSVESQNLKMEREQKESRLAKEQISVYMLRQRITQLEKQIEDMKKSDAKP